MLCYVKDKVVNINLVYLLSQIYWDCYILSIFLFLPVAKCLISLLCKSTIEMQHKSAVQSSKEMKTLSLFYFQHFLQIAIRIICRNKQHQSSNFLRKHQTGLLVRPLKVSKSQNQIVASWILPKNRVCSKS